MPVLSRLYTPSQFGVFAVAQTLVVTLGTVSSLRMEAAIPLADTRRQAFAVTHLALLASVATSVLSFAAAIWWGTNITAWLNVSALAPVLWACPVLVLCLGVFQTLNQLAIRAKRYASTARRTVVAAMGTVVGQLGLGLAGSGFGGLLAGYGLGQGLGAASMAPGSGLLSHDARLALHRADLLSSVRRFWRFPALSAPSALLNVLSLQAPISVMALLFGAEESGWLGMTQRVLALPVSLIGVAVGQVYLAELAGAARTNTARVQSMFTRATRLLSLMGIMLAVPLLVLGPWLFSFALGDNWRMSGQFAQATAASLAAQMLASPLAATLTVLERQWRLLCLDAARLLGTGGAMVLVWRLGGSPLAVAWALGLSGLATYLLYWWVSRGALRTWLAQRAAAVARDAPYPLPTPLEGTEKL
jgi:O-antigen/teichoic acid export membrane protein